MSITGLVLGSAALGGGALALGYGLVAGPTAPEPAPAAPEAASGERPPEAVHTTGRAAPPAPLRSLGLTALGGALLLVAWLGLLPALAFLFGAAVAALSGRIASTTPLSDTRASLGLGTAGAALLAPTATLLFLTGPADLAPTDRTVVTALVALALGAALPAALGRLLGRAEAAASPAPRLFETAVTATIAAMALPALVVKGVNAAEMTRLMLLPAGLGLAGLLATLGGLAALRAAPARPGPRALAGAGGIALLLAALATGLVTRLTLGSLSLPFGADLDGEGGYSGWTLYGAMLAGLAAAALMAAPAAARLRRPVSDSPATDRLPLFGAALALGIALAIAYRLAGPLGLAFAATALLAPLGLAAALGPGARTGEPTPGEMAVAAYAAPYAAVASTLSGLLLFAVYEADLDTYNSALGLIEPPDFSLASPYILSGLLLGALLPRLIGAPGATAPEAATPPRPALPVRLTTALLPVAAPLLVYAAASACGGAANGFAALGALLVGTALSGLFAALTQRRPAAIGAAVQTVPLVALLLLAALAYGG